MAIASSVLVILGMRFVNGTNAISLVLTALLNGMRAALVAVKLFFEFANSACKAGNLIEAFE